MRRVLALFILLCPMFPLRADEIDFETQIAPLLTQRCLSCHNPAQKKGGFDLSTRSAMVAGGESGITISPGDPAASLLIDYISGEKPQMPKAGKALSATEVEMLSEWVKQKLPWPEGVALDSAEARWWSLRPLKEPAVPEVGAEWASRVGNPIDAFVLAKLAERGLTPSGQADRRTLIRRLKFDLLGLPPTPEEVEQFVNDPDAEAYAKLVEDYLASPHYGERWARHWLDVVHYGDTHGYDKDKPRPHAYHYRDYVIRSFNADKRYSAFIREQIAGDVLHPGDPEGVIATGFIAAGPWDLISHVEVPESKVDGQIARSLDRDDMVRTTLETFNSVTIGCARCHDHKFDPIPMRDYYRLQAVFAAVDRADRMFDADPATHQKRQEHLALQRRLKSEQTDLDALIQKRAGDKLTSIDTKIKSLVAQSSTDAKPEFGYHSQISSDQNELKWVQVDLGEPVTLAEIVFVGCHDTYNNIGAGFGFPVRYRVEVSDDAMFQSGVTVLSDRTAADIPNPGVAPQRIEVEGITARYVRVTATKLVFRKDDYIFALAELQAFDREGANRAAGKTVTALDSIEAPIRWGKQNLVDGYFYGVELKSAGKDSLAELNQQRAKLIADILSPTEHARREELSRQISNVETVLGSLPTPQHVYTAATQFAPQGNHKATEGIPREIRLLHRGNITTPGDVVEAGTLSALEHGTGVFELADPADEGARRLALANWIADRENVLTWRSIVNRVWQYHFGQGIVETPNDFGRMGQSPSHPELLDWLAIHFRDNGQSLKALHRLICNSRTYQQVSTDSLANSEIDSGNRFLWRMNRKKLEAEAIRDAVLVVSGKLNTEMYGPGFQDFVIDKPQHSPHYLYDKHDPLDPKSHRRSVYRFVVRSQQQPFMTTMDCADPSMQVARRNETITPQQALAMLNNKFTVALSEQFALRVESEANDRVEQIKRAFSLALGRRPTDDELTALVAFRDEVGLANTCRAILNLNEFLFLD